MSLQPAVLLLKYNKPVGNLNADKVLCHGHKNKEKFCNSAVVSLNINHWNVILGLIENKNKDFTLIPHLSSKMITKKFAVYKAI